MQGWIWLWTALWFGGLAIFTYLAVQVTRHGFRDLRALFATVAAQHQAAEPDLSPDLDE